MRRTCTVRGGRRRVLRDQINGSPISLISAVCRYKQLRSHATFESLYPWGGCGDQPMKVERESQASVKVPNTPRHSKCAQGCQVSPSENNDPSRIPSSLSMAASRNMPSLSAGISCYWEQINIITAGKKAKLSKQHENSGRHKKKYQ